jgi:hypothetical protein
MEIKMNVRIAGLLAGIVLAGLGAQTPASAFVVTVTPNGIATADTIPAILTVQTTIDPNHIAGIFTSGSVTFNSSDGQQAVINIAGDSATFLQVGHTFTYNLPGLYIVTYDIEGTVAENGNAGFMVENQTVSKTGGDAILLIQGVPEPSTWAMLLLGFLGVGFMACRKRSATRFA